MPIFSADDIVAIGPWRSDQVKCHYAPVSWNVRDLSRVYVDAVWETYRKRYPSAFDGAMLGLAELQLQTDAELRLLVKITSYAKYVASREPAFQAKHPGVARANPLGMTIVLLSSEDQAVVTLRSAAADQNPGMPYFVGGYVEPPLNEDLADVIGVNANREIVEELGIQANAAIIMGMARDPSYCHPELFAVSRVRIRGTDVSQAWQNARDRHETGQLVMLPLSKLLSTSHEVLFAGGVTWSFAAATWLLKRCWNKVELLL